MDLFEKQKKSTQAQPLAVRMRPKTLCEFVGQEHILKEGKLLKRAIEADRISSVIFYGPHGSGNLRSMVNANALAIVPEGRAKVKEGDEIEVVVLGDPDGMGD